ncbi:ABC transporter substrate-binding protein [Paenibacillus sp. GD4]|uniref:ABC transporter substrate-binding protein n=1 Tax=Paenibacillus sp. GD4 TaxID=3068890 RepID=UPI0027964D9D|nr:ABC transporter substrate-binding protein [Paenibacillus sp. GD4]MDQ1913446.1 ABC transporter substrate-binding protein [Paenibacillus sp. GD4]
MKSTAMKAMASVLVLTTVLTACSKEEPAAQKNDAPQEPVTIRMMRYQGGYDKSEFEKYVSEPMKKKYPHITFEYDVMPQNTTLQDLIVSDRAPDIFLTGVRGLSDLLAVDFPLDVRDMSKKHNLDWNVYESTAQSMVKAYGSNGEMYAVPMWLNYYVTFYNKDIFDRFGIAYPKDNMTWEEMYDLAKTLTRLDGGIQYKGLQPGQVSLMGSGLALPYFEPNSDKVNLVTDSWARVFKLAKDFYTIPGNEPVPNLGSIFPNFITDKNIAMLPSYGSSMTRLADPQFNAGVNWDIVSYPSYSEKRGFSAETDGNVLVINKTSKVLDQAFKAAQAMSTDPEMQLDLAKRAATLPVLKLEQTQQVFGQAFPMLKEKNLKAIFAVKMLDTHPYNQYDSLARGPIMNRNFQTYLSKNEDQNTVLRRIQEEVTKAVEAAKLDKQNKKQ